jgi:hypothetical protein
MVPKKNKIIHMTKSFKRDLVFITHKNVHLFSPDPYLRDYKYHYNFNNLQCEGSQAFDWSSSCHSGCITSSSSFFFGLVYIIQTDLGYKVSFIERRVACILCPSTS